MYRFGFLLNAIRYPISFINKDLIIQYLGLSSEERKDLMYHLIAASEWICRAQDATNDGGVARSFLLVYDSFFKMKGWVPSYPETTGYIIPTMFDFARLTGSQEIYERAIRMVDWECKVQMDNGAVQGGTIDQIPTPAVFNTGQVIFGWIRAFQETQKEMYLHSAIKAGNYLV